MKRRSSHELTHAEARFRALVYELKLLMLAFPHFTDAFDKEDLPVKFLLKRGAARVAARTTRARKRTRAAAKRRNA
jgi:hypothetical protein